MLRFGFGGGGLMGWAACSWGLYVLNCVASMQLRQDVAEAVLCAMYAGCWSRCAVCAVCCVCGQVVAGGVHSFAAGRGDTGLTLAYIDRDAAFCEQVGCQVEYGLVLALEVLRCHGAESFKSMLGCRPAGTRLCCCCWLRVVTPCAGVPPPVCAAAAAGAVQHHLEQC